MKRRHGKESEEVLSKTDTYHAHSLFRTKKCLYQAITTVMPMMAAVDWGGSVDEVWMEWMGWMRNWIVDEVDW